MAKHLVVSSFFDVKNLSLQRQHRLELAVAPLFGGAAGRVTFDDEDLASRRVLLLAVSEFSWQGRRIQGSLSAGKVPGFSGRFTGTGCFNRFSDDLPGNTGILLKVVGQAFVDERFDQGL